MNTLLWLDMRKLLSAFVGLTICFLCNPSAGGATVVLRTYVGTAPTGYIDPWPGDREVGQNITSFDGDTAFTTSDGLSFASASAQLLSTIDGTAGHFDLRGTFSYTLSPTEEGLTQVIADVDVTFRLNYGTFPQKGSYTMSLEMEPFASYSMQLLRSSDWSGFPHGLFGQGSSEPVNRTLTENFTGYKESFEIRLRASLSASEADLPPDGTRTGTSSFVMRFDINPVPEPTSAMLIAIGTCLLGTSRILRRP